MNLRLRTFLKMMALIFGCSSLFAEEDIRLRSRPSSMPWFFLGVDGGYSRVNTSVLAEFDKNGYQLDVKGLGSYYLTNWVFDGGLGWLFNEVSGSEPPVLEETITTRALFAEIGARYRLSTHWQLGLLSRGVFGTDLEFGSQTNRTNFGIFSGLQAVYEIPLSHFLLRLTAQALTDLNIENRQLVLVEGGIQIGLPIPKFDGGKSSDTHGAPDVRITLQGGTFYFKFAKSKLSSNGRAHIMKMGRYLGEHLNLWDSIQIDGHTDERGSDDYNFILSKNRALAVRNALIKGGAPADRMEIAGYSFHKPKVQGKGVAVWKENRRVELKFYGVSDPKLLEEALQGTK